MLPVLPPEGQGSSATGSPFQQNYLFIGCIFFSPLKIWFCGVSEGRICIPTTFYCME